MLRVHALYTLLLKQNAVVDCIAFSAVLSQGMARCEDEKALVVASSVVARVSCAQKGTWAATVCGGSPCGTYAPVRLRVFLPPF